MKNINPNQHFIIFPYLKIHTCIFIDIHNSNLPCDLILKISVPSKKILKRSNLHLASGRDDWSDRKRGMWFVNRKGPSGFSASSTAEEVTQGINGNGLTAIVTGHFPPYFISLLLNWLNKSPYFLWILFLLLIRG